MRNILLASALVLMTSAAFAQTPTNTNNAAAGAASNSGASAGAVANPTINNIIVPTTNLRNNTNASAASRSSAGSAAVSGASGNSGASINQTFTSPAATTSTLTDNQNLSGTQTIRNTPSIQMPGILSGSPCAVGASAGGAGPGIGISFGGVFNSTECEMRMRAAIMLQAGNAGAAKEMLCDMKESREAFARAGQPCWVDIYAAQQAAKANLQPVAALSPPAPAYQPVAVAVPPQPLPPKADDWKTKLCGPPAPPRQSTDYAYYRQYCNKT